jgi:hypothetical protein
MADCIQQRQKDQAFCATVLIIGYVSLGETREVYKWRSRKNKLPGHVMEKQENERN